MILLVAFVAIALAAVICVLAATAGDGRAAREIEERRRAGWWRRR